MLIRCRCGRYTNFGLTCVHCQVDTTGIDKPRKKRKEDEEEEDEEVEEEIESFEDWEDIISNDDDD